MNFCLNKFEILNFSLNDQPQKVLNNGIIFFYLVNQSKTKVLNISFILTCTIQTVNSQSPYFSILSKLRPKLTFFPRSNTANLQLVTPPKIAPTLFPRRIFEKLRFLYPTYNNILSIFFSYCSLDGNNDG